MKKKMIIVTFIVLLILLLNVFLFRSIAINHKNELYTNFVESARKVAYEFETIENEKEMNELVNSSTIAITGYGILVDSSYNIVYHPRKDLVGKSLLDLDLPNFVAGVDRINNGENDFVQTYDFEDNEVLNHYYYNERGVILVHHIMYVPSEWMKIFQ